MVVTWHPYMTLHAPRVRLDEGRRRPYPDAPRRAEVIRDALQPYQLFRFIECNSLPRAALTRVHDDAYLRWLAKTARGIGPTQTVWPTVFPARAEIAAAHKAELHPLAAGYIRDTRVALTAEAWRAALGSAAAAFEAARRVAGGARAAYALTRPPGGQCERDRAGGFGCINHTAVAAAELARHGRVAIISLGPEHFCGVQRIFYESDRVHVFSIHADPRECYPFVSGFAHETGAGAGRGANVNVPLSPGVTFDKFRTRFRALLGEVLAHEPRFVVVAADFSGYYRDRVAPFDFDVRDYSALFDLVAALGLPAVVIQEGGYALGRLGALVRAALLSFHRATLETPQSLARAIPRRRAR